MFLIDTNIFLEILLNQNKKESCKKFLSSNADKLSITDFSLHSIGVILFRYHKEDIFQKFAEDIMPNTKLISLPIGLYEEVVDARKSMDLDFDDAYQYSLAKYYRLKLVTIDRDFRKVKDIEVIFL